MGEINIDFNGLLETSKNLESIANQLQEKIENFQKVSREIIANNIWVGNDASQYSDSIHNKYIRSLIKMDNALYDYANFLGNASRVYKALENAMGEEKVV